MCRAQKCSDFAAAAKLNEVFLVQFSGRYSLKTVGVNDDEGPPVPISNTEVKLARADNTWLETAREDRSTPTQRTDVKYIGSFFVLFAEKATGMIRTDGIPPTPL